MFLNWLSGALVGIGGSDFICYRRRADALRCGMQGASLGGNHLSNTTVFFKSGEERSKLW